MQHTRLSPAGTGIMFVSAIVSYDRWFSAMWESCSLRCFFSFTVPLFESSESLERNTNTFLPLLFLRSDFKPPPTGASPSLGQILISIHRCHNVR